VTNLVLGKCTETRLFKAFANQFTFVPKDWRLMYDKGLRGKFIGLLFMCLVYLCLHKSSLL
jgi:hypothetical protein